MRLFFSGLSTVLVLVGGPRGRDAIDLGVTDPGGTDPDGREEAALPEAPPPPNVNAHPVDEIIDRNKQELLAVAGVEGVGRGLTATGDDAVVVWVSDAAAAQRVPAEIAGVPVIVEQVPGGFHAQ